MDTLVKRKLTRITGSDGVGIPQHFQEGIN